ncbi:endonuclease domain-containing protein (plasmid) [Shewanella xiamenensis]|uniref:Endonuclease domain-containing protein n=1 Tax=Shewanella xiamenensis TaxID=332186 RepID=A0ABT6UDU1_9GAMM|nr:hypothetical protein [Shewanella xiamenensis]MDI5832639.1 endonuclease domain-containing protein [Shewanella xiamenensis]WHF58003.1 endonuclease domain-containing protein [Shewanella xiamenensis]
MSNNQSLKASGEHTPSKPLVINRPFNFERAAAMLGSEEAALALYETLKDPHCSKEGLSVILEVMHGVAGGKKLEPHCFFDGKTKKHSFYTSTTIKNEFFENSEFSLDLVFTPEQKVNKNSFRADLDGNYYVDLGILLRLTGKAPEEFGGGLNTEINVVVEFDGHSHLADEQVRKDKMRDSVMQTQSIHIFRIQSPYFQNTANYQIELQKTIDFHVTNIKCLFWNQFNTFGHTIEKWNAYCERVLLGRAERNNRSTKPVSSLELF